MHRRTFLKRWAGLALFLLLSATAGFRYFQGWLRDYSDLQPDEGAPAGILSQDEFNVIHAVFEVIAPRPAPSSGSLRQFVQVRTERVPGYLREYRDAARMFESRARERFGQGFDALEPAPREGLVSEALLETDEGTSSFAPYRKIQTLYRVFSNRSEARFKTFVFPDLLHFYWSSTEGWAAVGYDSRPGLPDADPRAYTYPPRSPAEAA